MDLKDMKVPENVAGALKTCDLDNDQTALVGNAVLASIKEVAEKAVTEAVTEKETAMTEQFKDHKDPETVKTELDIAIKAAVETDRAEQKELATKTEARAKDISEAGIELSEYKKEQMGGFAFDEAGDIAYKAWFEDIKATAKASAAAPAKTKETPKPALSTASGAANESDDHVTGAF